MRKMSFRDCSPGEVGPALSWRAVGAGRLVQGLCTNWHVSLSASVLAVVICSLLCLLYAGVRVEEAL